MAGDNNKKEQFEARILGELNTILRSRFNNPRLQFLSFTKVKLSKDYSIANVYWDTYDSSKKGDCKKAVESITGKLRSHLAAALKVRAVPELHIRYDAQYEAENEIERILQEEKDNGKGF